MESYRLLDNAEQDGPAPPQSFHAQFWFYLIHFLRWILCTLSERVTSLELWTMGADESHRQAESQTRGTIFIRIDNPDGDDYYCEALLDTGSGFNLISTTRVSELGLSYRNISKEEEEKVAITDLDGTTSHPIGTLEINYRGGHHGHSPQGVGAATFYVLHNVPCEILLGRPALNDLHVFTFDPLYFSKPPRRTPKERVLLVPESEKQERGVYFAGGRKGLLPVSRTFFPRPQPAVVPPAGSIKR